jgi:MOSC domain-containing protein YiiM
MKGRIAAISRSERRGVSKKNIPKGYLKKDHGLEGDAHSGKGPKQISLLAVESIKRLNGEKKIDASPGDFAENITTEGLNLIQLVVGTRLKIGKAVIEVTQIGKEPGLSHKFSYRGHSLLPTEGIFAQVIENGKVNPGDEIQVLLDETKK